jgi:MFS family permease
LSAAILLAGQGLQATLLPVRASLESFSTIAIGSMGAAYFFGFTLGCIKGGELVRRVGHIRVFLAMSAIASAAPLLHGLIVSPLAWNLLRFVTGFCLASLYMVIESWLNESSNNTNRGLIFSMYTMITLTMMAAGQMMTLLAEPTGLQLFIIASVLFSVGAVPVALSVAPAPAQPARTDINLRELLAVSPSGAMGCFVAGLATGSFWGLAPVFAGVIGDAASMAAWFMAAVVIGGAVTQWPLGLLSDRFGRRKLLVVVALLAGLAGIALAAGMAQLGVAGTIFLAAAWGGFALPVYSISIAYANDYADPSEYVRMSAGLLLVYGLGAIAGPFIASALMTWHDPSSLFWFTATTHAILIAFITFRFIKEGNQADEPIAFGDALAAAQTASQVYEEELGD